MTGALQAASRTGAPGALRIAWHELRTPLFLIREAARLLDAGAPISQRDSRRALEIILRQAEAMQRVLDTLAPPGPTVEPCRTPVGTVLEAVGAEVADLPSARPLELDGDLDLTVAVPEGAVHMVLLNVVANAARYALGGTTVRVNVVAEGDGVLTTVSNASGQIPDDVRAHLFEPYTRYGEAPPTGSAGLGLHIARAVAEAHGGEVDLDVSGSDPARVTVSVLLPAG